MAQVRCRACGFITNEDKLGEICPACGIPRKAFEQYTETMSKKRVMILGLNLHPIAVHFPQAFAVVVPIFIMAGVAAGPSAGPYLLATARVLSVLLPFTVLAALACGLVDGRTRFKTFVTPLLVRKMIGGSVLLVLSSTVAAVALLLGTDYPGRLYILFLSSGCIACEIFLAEIGKTMMNAKLPG
jgi:hypothetical protein